LKRWPLFVGFEKARKTACSTKSVPSVIGCIDTLQIKDRWVLKEYQGLVIAQRQGWELYRPLCRAGWCRLAGFSSGGWSVCHRFV